MKIEVLSEAWLPPRLLFREDRVERLRGLVGPGRVVGVVGPSGVGKTSLTIKALRGLRVDCSVKRDYASIIRELARQAGVNARSIPAVMEGLLSLEPHIVVLDDFTLARRTRRLVGLVEKLSERHAVVLVAHPSIKPELTGITDVTIEMPPYSDKELYEILEDRVIRGALPVSEEAIHAVSERIGYPKGSGSARLAIISLKKALEICTSHRDPEVTERHVQAAFRLLSL